MNLRGKRVLVVGLGRSGRAAADVAVRRGAAVVGVDLRTDLEPIEGVRLELGPHRRQTFLDADLIVVSPGVPATQRDLAAAHAHQVPVLGELAFADALLDAPMVAITGTNGKSTVTAFTGQLLRAAGMRVFVGGNLGNPLCLAVDDGPWDALVVEVSSYQLEWPGSLRPRAAVLLNLTPDHLARHGDMDGYAAAKARLFGRMGPGDIAVWPRSDARLTAACSGTHAEQLSLGALPGLVRTDTWATIELPGVSATLDLSGLRVPGAHNLDNAATAGLLALAAGATADQVQDAIGGLEGLPHRMQIVGTDDGLTWIDDSKATNVEAAQAGLSGLGAPAVVLLGGQAKGPGFAALAPALGAQRAVVAFGASGPDIADELEAAGLQPVRAGALEDAVAAARALAHPGDVVLLSPGCASFDAFTDFEQRGRAFARFATRSS